MDTKTIGIFTDLYFYRWDGDTVKNGIGGSETWAYEVSVEFAKRGYDVTLYAYPPQDYNPLPNCHIVDYTKYFEDIKTRRYDYFIYSRYLDNMSPYLKCDNVYCMVHDTELYLRNNQLGLSRIKKYCYLSEWHKDHLLSIYSDLGLTEDRLYKVSNGFSKEYYQNINLNNKINSMLWSSSLTRGFDDFYKFVFLPILKEFPDFKLYVCSGTMDEKDKQLLYNVSLLPGVEVLGKLPKKTLAEYQINSKIWVYPGSFPETFCITAVENCAAGNVVISPKSYGLSTTLKDLDYLNFGILNERNAYVYIDFIRNILLNDDERIKYANKCMEIAEQYSWSNTVDEFINLFESES